MGNATEKPKIRLSNLRDIGWQLWDPIGILSKGESWEGEPFADEYDSYLMQAAGRLRRDQPTSEVIQYLVDIEIYHMGVARRKTAEHRATRTVEAIMASDQIWV